MTNGAQRTFNLTLKEIVPTVRPYTLEGEDAPEILRAFNARVDSDYNGNPFLKVLKLREIEGIKVLVGSNPLILPVVQEVLPSFRIARPEQIEMTLREGDPVKIGGNHYVDYGIVMDFSGKDHDLAVEVFNQIPKEQRDLDRLPALMVGYGLKNSSAGLYGVAPVYQDGTELRIAKILAKPISNFDANDSELIRSGLPSQLGSGNREIANAEQKAQSLGNLGISWLFLNGDLDLVGSRCDDFASSGDLGRVVLVRDKVASA